MMPGHGYNPIFFNKIIKIERAEHSLTTNPPTSDNISFFLTTLPSHPPTLKVDIICVSPLKT